MAAALGLGLLLGLLGLLWDPGGATEVLHSLRYLAVAVSEPSPGMPQFMEIGYLDGIPFERYNSERGRMEPLTQWVKNGVDLEYWNRNTQKCMEKQLVAARNLQTAQDRYKQTRGLHRWLEVYGCDVLSDGSIRGSYRISYDDQDFMSFDLGSKRFVAADSAAEVTRRCWEDENKVEWWTNYLGHVCPEWLQKYVRYAQKELDRKEPPDVHVSGKEEHGMLTLSCHVYGFYPKTIAVNWMKGDEIRDQETQWGGVVPNSDGTFHTWARIVAQLGESAQYRCRMEHSGMLEPEIFTKNLPSGVILTVVVVQSVIIAIIIVAALIGFFVRKRQSGMNSSGYSMAAGNDAGAKA